MSPDPRATQVRTFRTVLLATDLTAASSEATDRAIELCARLGARLLIVNVMDSMRLVGGGAHDRIDQARAEREGILVEVVREARAAGAAAEFLIWTGDPGNSLVAAAEAERADMLVVGSRDRRGAERMLLGSVSDHLVHHAGCPVLVVHPPKAAD